jgi:hydroxymethylpyrimidine/phosphomethylpyrimidine kinase
VITCITVQDSCKLSALTPLPETGIIDQAEAVLADCRVAAIKLGLLGHSTVASALGQLLRDHPDIPVVLDPVLATGAGQDLASQSLLEVILEQLLPLCTLITPNSLEARRLCRADLPLAEAARRLLSTGLEAVLITGTHEDTERVSNHLYHRTGLYKASDWDRLPGEYHGSGCTLAAAIAARLAGGMHLPEAVQQGLAFTWKSLQKGFRSGRCQAIPDRLFALERQG